MNWLVAGLPEVAVKDPVPELVPDREASPNGRPLGLTRIDPDLARHREEQPAHVRVSRQPGTSGEAALLAYEQPVVVVGDRLNRDGQRLAVPEPVRDRGQLMGRGRLGGQPALGDARHRPPRKRRSTSSPSPVDCGAPSAYVLELDPLHAREVRGLACFCCAEIRSRRRRRAEPREVTRLLDLGELHAEDPAECVQHPARDARRLDRSHLHLVVVELHLRLLASHTERVRQLLDDLIARQLGAPPKARQETRPEAGLAVGERRELGDGRLALDLVEGLLREGRRRRLIEGRVEESGQAFAFPSRRALEVVVDARALPRRSRPR